MVENTLLYSSGLNEGGLEGSHLGCEIRLGSVPTPTNNVQISTAIPLSDATLLFFCLSLLLVLIWIGLLFWPEHSHIHCKSNNGV